MSMRIMKKFKKGDQVIVTIGKDKGRTGEILEVYPKLDRVKVKGIGIYKKHRKPTQDQAGGVIELERPISTAKIMLVEDGKPVRVGLKRSKSKLERVSKKSGKTI